MTALLIHWCGVHVTVEVLVYKLSWIQWGSEATHWELLVAMQPMVLGLLLSTKYQLLEKKCACLTSNQVVTFTWSELNAKRLFLKNLPYSTQPIAVKWRKLSPFIASLLEKLSSPANRDVPSQVKTWLKSRLDSSQVIYLQTFDWLENLSKLTLPGVWFWKTWLSLAWLSETRDYSIIYFKTLDTVLK